MVRIVSSSTKVVVTGHLDESEANRRDQRRMMLALLRHWEQAGSPFDAIDLGPASTVDYLVVHEDSYHEGPLPLRVGGQVEYKRRRGPFAYPSVFLEDHKRSALLDWRHRLGGIPIFVTEWDDVTLIVDVRVTLDLPVSVMARTDRGRDNDTDTGVYIPRDMLFELTS